MNEIIFFIHIITLLLIIFICSRIGKMALAIFSAICMIIANIFVIKQIHLFSFEVTATDAYAVAAIVTLNLLQEAYGREQVKTIVWINFLALFIFGVMSQIQLLYLPSNSDWAHSSFVNIFKITPRIFIASLCSYFVSQRIDIEIFSKLKKLFNNKVLYLRILLSACITQAIDTILFSFLGLYGIVSSLYAIIAMSFIVKMICIATLASSALIKNSRINEV